MFKNLTIPAVECLENGNYHVYRKLFPAKQHFFKWIQEPENCKNQETNRIESKKLRDGPFDIQGGGWDFSSRRVIFFSLFAQQVSFFKSKLQQDFYFFWKKHIKIRKM